MDPKPGSSSRSTRKRNSAAVSSDGDTPAVSSHKQRTEAKSSSKKQAAKASADKRASSSSREKRSKKAKREASHKTEMAVVIESESAKPKQPSAAVMAIELRGDRIAGPSSSTAALESPLGTLSAKDDGADEQECSDLLTQQLTTTNADSELHARVRELEAELKSAKESLKTKNGLATSQHEVFEELQSSCSCQICLEPVWRPCVLAPCGHIFCIRCLQSWFTRPLDSEAAPPIHFSEEARAHFLANRTLKRKKICPSCRTELACAPVEIWLVREILEKVQGALELVPTNNPAPSASQEETQKRKGDDLPAASKIWNEIFDASGPRRIIFDEVDRVSRCGTCAAEIEDGMCSNPSCAIEYDSEALADQPYDEFWDSEDYSDVEEDDDWMSFVLPHGHLMTERRHLLGHPATHPDEDHYLEGEFMNDYLDDSEGYSDEEMDDFLPGPRRAHTSAVEPIEITDDSEHSDDSSIEVYPTTGGRRRLQRATLVDDEAEDEEDDEDDDDDFDEDEDDGDLSDLVVADDADVHARPTIALPKNGETTDATRTRTRRVIRDSDDEA